MPPCSRDSNIEPTAVLDKAQASCPDTAKYNDIFLCSLKGIDRAHLNVVHGFIRRLQDKLLNEVHLGSIGQDHSNRPFRSVRSLIEVFTFLIARRVGGGASTLVDILVGDAVKLVVNQRCEVVEKSYNELGLVIVAITELWLGFIALFCGYKCDWWEFTQQALSLLFADAVLQIVFVKEVVGHLCDVWVASVLRTEQNRRLPLVL